MARLNQNLISNLSSQLGSSFDEFVGLAPVEAPEDASLLFFQLFGGYLICAELCGKVEDLYSLFEAMLFIDEMSFPFMDTRLTYL